MQFKREKYLDQLIERMHNGQIKVITGVRRCGKSFLLFNIFAEYLKYLTESFLFRQAKHYDVKGKKYFEYPSEFYCEDIGLVTKTSMKQWIDEKGVVHIGLYDFLLQDDVLN